MAIWNKRHGVTYMDMLLKKFGRYAYEKKVRPSHEKNARPRKARNAQGKKIKLPKIV